MKVLVCGSRTWTDMGPIQIILDGLALRDGLELLEGGAKGADDLAAQWASTRDDIDWEQFSANWLDFGKAAGPIRNKLMLEKGKPDLVVAFSDRPITKGTANMIRQAKEKGVPVWVISHE